MAKHSNKSKNGQASTPVNAGLNTNGLEGSRWDTASAGFASSATLLSPDEVRSDHRGWS